MVRRVLMVCTLVSLLGAAHASAPAPAVDRKVPRQVRVSFGEDHLFVSLRAVFRPEDLGQADWSRWDEDGDGRINGGEQQVLSAALRQAAMGSICVAVDGQVVALGPLVLQPAGSSLDSSGPDAKWVVRTEGRLDLERGRPTYQWVIYDRPGNAETYTAVSVASVAGLEFGSISGSVRAERRGARRVEAVLSSLAPALWGQQKRAP